MANFNFIKEELVQSNQLLLDEKYGLIATMNNLKNSLKRLSENSDSYEVVFNFFVIKNALYFYSQTLYRRNKPLIQIIEDLRYHNMN